MFCPRCQNTLRERERNNVILDICPGCGGIWLDRGELEKLTTSERSYYRRDDDDDDDDDWERGRRYDMPADDRRDADRPPERYRGDDRNYGENRGYGQQHRKKHGGCLENIFGNFGEGGADD